MATYRSTVNAVIVRIDAYVDVSAARVLHDNQSSVYVAASDLGRTCLSISNGLGATLGIWHDIIDRVK